MTTNPDPPTKLIRNSTAEFLIFTAQDGDSSIEARYEDETIWLTQRLMAELFGVDVRTVSEHPGNVCSSAERRSERGRSPWTAVGTGQNRRALSVPRPQPGHMPSPAAPARLPSGQSTGGKDERA